ncbi:hypothetical protein HFO84_00055 [Rhizobium leguminosarum]|uniref:hypothetical protein n=1 Tax=Rhizobium leguminosarum TaxID=384 RepID=UPI001C9575C0|nr:hypothetical protein [Rhizobium leguminosarum]MBY5475723.1 hypothetical protein [Rhizobium leguminosarum]
MFSTMKLYLAGGAAILICGLAVACSLMWSNMSSQSLKIRELTETVEQQKRDAEALNDALAARDLMISEAQEKAWSVRKAIAPLRNTEADPEISPIMRRYLEEQSK